MFKEMINIFTPQPIPTISVLKVILQFEIEHEWRAKFNRLQTLFREEEDDDEVIKTFFDTCSAVIDNKRRPGRHTSVGHVQVKGPTCSEIGKMEIDVYLPIILLTILCMMIAFFAEGFECGPE